MGFLSTRVFGTQSMREAQGTSVFRDSAQSPRWRQTFAITRLGDSCELSSGCSVPRVWTCASPLWLRSSPGTGGEVGTRMGPSMPCVAFGASPIFTDAPCA